MRMRNHTHVLHLFFQKLMDEQNHSLHWKVHVYQLIQVPKYIQSIRIFYLKKIDVEILLKLFTSIVE
jgi:hypothetical protein